MKPEEITTKLTAAADKFDLIAHKPTDSDLQNIREVLHPILLSIAWDDKHNLIGLILEHAAYKQLYKEAFPTPTRPPSVDDTIAKDATPAQISIANKTHDAAIAKYEQYEAAFNGVSHFFQENIQKTYISGLKNQYTYYTNVTPMEFITHLQKNAAGLDDTEVVDLPLEMRKFLPESDNLLVYFEKMEEAQCKSVRGGLPISNENMVALAIKALMASNMFPVGMTEWNTLIKAQQTWKQLKEIFLDAEEKHDLFLRAQGENGPLANAATTGYPPAGVPMAELPTMLDNLALAVTQDKDLLDQLVANNTVNTETIATLTATNKSQAATIKSQAEQINALKKKAGEGNSRPVYSASNPNPAWVRGKYCWSHGYGCTAGHTSETCNLKRLGHKDNATRANTMGGSDKNKGWD